MSGRGWFGIRNFQRTHADGHRFILKNGMPLLLQKRNASTKCTVCWDEYAGNFSEDCEACNGTGYDFTDSLRHVTAIVQFAQPTGNFGVGDVSMRAGGRLTKTSNYVYVSKLDGNTIKEGDRFYYSIQGASYENELVVINVQPQLGQRGEVMLYMFECMTPADKLLEDELGSVDD